MLAPATRHRGKPGASTYGRPDHPERRWRLSLVVAGDAGLDAVATGDGGTGFG